jgi:hypothetical protein
MRVDADGACQGARTGAIGTIRSAELDGEHGRPIYSFDIDMPNRDGVEEA